MREREVINDSYELKIKGKLQQQFQIFEFLANFTLTFNLCYRKSQIFEKLVDGVQLGRNYSFDC